MARDLDVFTVGDGFKRARRKRCCPLPSRPLVDVST